MTERRWALADERCKARGERAGGVGEAASGRRLPALRAKGQRAWHESPVVCERCLGMASLADGRPVRNLRLPRGAAHPSVTAISCQGGRRVAEKRGCRRLSGQESVAYGDPIEGSNAPTMRHGGSWSKEGRLARKRYCQRVP